MDTLQAAVLLAKLEIFDEEVAARARIGARYTELLNHDPQSTIHEQRPTNNNPRIITPYIAPENTSVYAQYTVQVDNRDEVMKRLASGSRVVNCGSDRTTSNDPQSTPHDSQLSIPTAVHYPIPLHLQPVFAAFGQGKRSFPKAESAAKRVMSLPMHPYLTGSDQERIAEILKVSLL
jgi:UDP-2-acetamido-2-deoxy-ribo-hexuluronate aminotransferase